MASKVKSKDVDAPSPRVRTAGDTNIQIKPIELANTTKKSGAKEGTVKIGKLKVNKETVQDLTGSTKRKVKGGLADKEIVGSGRSAQGITIVRTIQQDYAIDHSRVLFRKRTTFVCRTWTNTRLITIVL